MKKTLKTFLADESGATAIEYGPIAAGIAFAIITVVNGMAASSTRGSARSARR